MTKKHLKIGQKYKALLLKEFHQIFSYFQWMLSYPKTIYCKCFVLPRQVPMTQVTSAKTPLSPNSENCWNIQSLGQNISNAGACFKKRSIPSRRRDFILTLSAKKSLGTHLIIPQEDCKHVVHHRVPASIFSIITRYFGNYGTATDR